VAQASGLAMGLGSGRALLEHPDVLDTFDVRPLAPDALLLANLGAVQLNKGVTVDDCRRLVGRLRADALVLHLNPLQEALQPEGDVSFGGLLARIEALCGRLEAPVVVKEVGWGIAPDTVRRLLDAGVAAIDVAGAGGTSWSEVERHRIEDPVRSRVAAAFAGWGISTAEALRLARAAAPDAPVFASGGVRTGLDVAKAVALGADLVGMARPFLLAADEGGSAAGELALELVEVLRVAMFCVGAGKARSRRRTGRRGSRTGPRAPASSSTSPTTWRTCCAPPAPAGAWSTCTRRTRRPPSASTRTSRCCWTTSGASWPPWRPPATATTTTT
jgi:isopentenyl-diphosphate delta-isomerase